MEGLKGSKSFQPGFRFHPTDEELFMYYLKRKVLGKSLSPEMIAEVDVYQYAPWELPRMASLKTRDLYWYFFCPRAKKYPNGGRANRATVQGYWKSTGNDRTMMYKSRSVGKIKTLIFHRGKAPKGERTDWVMHEYRMEDKVLAEKGVPQESFVVCKIYEKSGVGPRNGEHYGARFVEEEWDSDGDDDVQARGLEVMPADLGPRCVGDSPYGSISALTTVVVTPESTSPPAIFAPSNTTSPAVIPVAADGVYPDISTTLVDTPSTTARLDTLNVIDPSVGIECVLTPSSGSPSAATVAGAQDENELDRLLSCFTEDDSRDIFNGLGDLTYPSGHYDLGWRDYISMDDLS